MSMSDTIQLIVNGIPKNTNTTTNNTTTNNTTTKHF